MSVIDQTIAAFTPTSGGWLIAVTGGGRADERIRLGGDAFVIGRSPECGIRLDHPMVSRGHARLDRSPEGRWHITDLGSHNGTLVNGRRLTAASPLSRGDRIAIGPFTMALESAPAPVRMGVGDDQAVLKTLGELEPPRLAVEQLNRLDEFGRQVLETADANARLSALCRLMLHPQFGARWAVIVAAGSDGEPSSVYSPPNDSGEVPTLSRSLIRAAVRKGEPVIATNSQSFMAVPDDIQMSISPELTTLAAVAVPLVTGIDGSMRLLCAGFPPQYGTGEWLALCGLAVRQYRQAETVWANIAAGKKLVLLQADLERARKVQDRLVPKQLDLPGLDVAVRFRPCHGVAGDYVDALALPDGRALIVIADVSGKGLAAAMVAMGLHTVVHAAIRRWNGLADLAAALDAHLVESLPPESFVTLFALTMDPRTGAIEAVNAGHPPAVAFGQAGPCREIGSDGDIMLGPFPQALSLKSGELGLDESMLLLTDGCLEVFDSSGEMLGTDELCRRVGGPIAAAPDAATAADAVIQFLDQWQGDGEAGDDRTLLLVRRKR